MSGNTKLLPIFNQNHWVFSYFFHYTFNTTLILFTQFLSTLSELLLLFILSIYFFAVIHSALSLLIAFDLLNLINLLNASTSTYSLFAMVYGIHSFPQSAQIV